MLKSYLTTYMLLKLMLQLLKYAFGEFSLDILLFSKKLLTIKIVIKTETSSPGV